jgi:Gpi18-like mannosyltransferase
MKNTLIIGITLLYASLSAGSCFLLFRKNKDTAAAECLSTEDSRMNFLLILTAALFLRLPCMLLNHDGDLQYFMNASEEFLNQGFFGFFGRWNIVYPPLFEYLLFLIGKLSSLLGITFIYGSKLTTFLFKIPGVLFDLLTGWILYRITSRQKRCQETLGLTLSLLYLFSPVTILDSAYIGQVDSIYSFFTLLTVYLICTKRLELSYFAFAAGFLLKYQIIFITPVLIFGIVNQVVLTDFSWKRFFHHFKIGLTAIGCILLSYLPFIYQPSTGEFRPEDLLHTFGNSLGSYGRASLNAYNFWTLIGYNLVDEKASFGPFSCSVWGTIAIVALVCASIFLFLKYRKDASSYPMIGAFLIFGMYCFSTKMMGRYLFPALGLLFLGFILKPNRTRFLCALLPTNLLFCCIALDYLYYPYSAYRPELLMPRILSVLVLGCFGFLVWTMAGEIRCLYPPNRKSEHNDRLF